MTSRFPLLVWFAIQVFSLVAYAALVVQGCGWWAVPILLLAAMRGRPPLPKPA